MECNKDCFNCPFPDCIWAGTNADQCKRYYQRHKEEICQKKREKYRKSKNKNAQYCHTYYQKHREEILRKKKEKRMEAKQNGVCVDDQRITAEP